MADAAGASGLETLLQEIARNLADNQRFLQALREDRLDETGEIPEEEPFEEL